MATRPVDAKAAERCASIVGAKQNGDEPPPCHVSVTDVALSWFPQNATFDDRCRQNRQQPASRDRVAILHWPCTQVPALANPPTRRAREAKSL